MGCASSIARISGVTMPWVIIRAMRVGKFFPFVVIGCMATVCGIAIMFLKKDTTGKPLDMYDSDETIDENLSVSEKSSRYGDDEEESKKLIE